MQAQAKRRKQPKRLSPEQLRGVESPATVMLLPIQLGKTADWWTHDNVLIGGICINSISKIDSADGIHRTALGYLPTLIPRSWEESEFGVVLEYETESDGANFRFRVMYGCGDPSELHLGQTEPIQGKTAGKQRVTFRLNPEYIRRNELFRCTLEVARESPDAVLIYGAWLEVGVD